MARRVSMVMALTLTVITVFAIVVIGRSNGLFGGADGSDEAAASQEELNGALLYLAALNATPATDAQPQVITEYVYIDEPAGPPQVTYVTRPGTASEQPAPQSPASGAMPLTDGSSGEAQDPEQPTATTPVEEHDDQTARSDDGYDEDGGGGGTSPAAPGNDEIEFTGTVTATDGENVTFSSGGGGSTVVRVVENVDQLEPGVKAKVHAIWVSGGWVAKEIELEAED